MKQQVLSRFDIPLLPSVALILFFLVFLFYVYWILKKENKALFESQSHLPLEEGKIYE